MSGSSPDVPVRYNSGQRDRELHTLRCGLIVLGMLGILVMPLGQLVAKSTVTASVDSVLNADRSPSPNDLAIVLAAHQNATRVIVRLTAVGGAAVALLAFGTLYVAGRKPSGVSEEADRHVT